jgi:hypothetical protein
MVALGGMGIVSRKEKQEAEQMEKAVRRKAERERKIQQAEVERQLRVAGHEYHDGLLDSFQRGITYVGKKRKKIGKKIERALAVGEEKFNT